jgi:hypothetical protein
MKWLFQICISVAVFSLVGPTAGCLAAAGFILADISAAAEDRHLDRRDEGGNEYREW